MQEYHKINTIYKRDEKGRLVIGNWSREEFHYLRDCTWVGTEKVDGMNIRIGWSREGEVDIRGRTDRAQLPPDLDHLLRTTFTPSLFEGAIDPEKTDSLVLYGEGYGNRIQKAGRLYDPSGVRFVLFDIRIGDWWLDRPTCYYIAMTLGIHMVPVVFEGTLEQAVFQVRSGFESEWGSFPAEGLVLRPLVELQTRSGHRIITKLKTKDFRNAVEAV